MKACQHAADQPSVVAPDRVSQFPGLCRLQSFVMARFGASGLVVGMGYTVCAVYGLPPMRELCLVRLEVSISITGHIITFHRKQTVNGTSTTGHLASPIRERELGHT